MVTLQQLKDETIANLEKLVETEAEEHEIGVIEMAIDAFLDAVDANGGKLVLTSQPPSAKPQIVKVGQASEKASIR